jgi:hypothetical protein
MSEKDLIMFKRRTILSKMKNLTTAQKKELETLDKWFDNDTVKASRIAAAKGIQQN